MLPYNADILKIERIFLPQNFNIKSWESIENYFMELNNFEIETQNDLDIFLKNCSELEAAISEDICWRQIKMTCDTNNKLLEADFNFACTEIIPKIQPWMDKLNKKLIAHPLSQNLGKEYMPMLRNTQKNIELFNEKNISLQAELQVKQQQFGMITGAMQVVINDKEYTLQQAAKFLESKDRKLREEVYFKIQERRLQDKDKLNTLFDALINIRHEIASNCNFETYTTYRYKELGRFDYTTKEAIDFQNAVQQYIVPLVNTINEDKKQALGYNDLRPWDLEASPDNEKSLQPFTNSKDLLKKVKDCFTSIDPFFGNCLSKMETLGHFDLESRQGKAPGGYNCPLAETGAPFIFMNAAGTMDDVTTMLHEGGHAIHSFLSHGLKLNGMKEYPTEIAEVASMSMELISMAYWDKIFDNDEDIRLAKKHQLERVITIFPWIAIIDKFQHWIYAHPLHNVEERSLQWKKINADFKSSAINFKGLDNFLNHNWQRQLHLYEVPFYYIEYGIAQLGAIGLWQQYIKNPTTAINNYCNALALGNTKTLPELFNAAGLDFDFSPEKIKNLIEFVQDEYNKVK